MKSKMKAMESWKVHHRGCSIAYECRDGDTKFEKEQLENLKKYKYMFTTFDQRTQWNRLSRKYPQVFLEKAGVRKEVYSKCGRMKAEKDCKGDCEWVNDSCQHPLQTKLNDKKAELESAEEEHSKRRTDAGLEQHSDIAAKITESNEIEPA